MTLVTQAETLVHDQFLLEEQQAQMTIERIRQRHQMAADRGDFASSDAGRMATNAILKSLTDGFTLWFQETSSGVPGKRCAPLKPLLSTTMSPEKVAYLALQSVLDRVLQARKDTPATQAKISGEVGNRIHDELRLSHIKTESKGLLARWEKVADARSLTRERKREYIMKQMRNMKLEWSFEGTDGVTWTEEVRNRVGAVVFEKLRLLTGIVEIKNVFQHVSGSSKTRSTSIVVPTKTFLEFVDQAQEFLTNSNHVYMPMVIPPKPWTKETGLYGGGYYTEHVPEYPLVKRAKGDYLDALELQDITVVLSALNAVQDTPWRINPKMLETLKVIYARDQELAGLPHSNLQDLPPPPVDGEFDPAYRAQCFRVHDKNRRDLTKRLFVTRVIGLAEQFKDREAIYFPHDLDSRGRAYPKPAHLNPQGPDFVKGLLEFANGKPLGTEDAACWLAIHVANSWGEDKAKLDERIQWTEDNSDLIVSVAKDPITDLRWTEADSPFLFLQAAMAWAGYLEEGLEYVCRVPIAVDATCSGLQHYSAMLLDKVGGAAVNLRDLQDRQDVYEDVAKRTLEIMKDNLGTDQHNLAEAWVNWGVTRKITKRSVMVVPYAATFSACMKYTREAVNERVSKGDIHSWEGDDSEFIVFGAKCIWQAISEVVVAATEAMQWISKAASTYSKNKEHRYLEWATPSGFLVRHRKPDLDNWRMNTILDGSRIQTRFITAKPNLKPQKMASATPPSFVHSLDAAHMCLSIDAAVLAGLGDFAVVHDSFATHAADMGVFGRCIRDTFHAMYTECDMLEHLRDQLQDGLEDPLPPLPQRGDLDLDEVRLSTFFFS